MQAVKGGHYHVGCTRLFELTHKKEGIKKGDGLGQSESVSHPNRCVTLLPSLLIRLSLILFCLILFRYFERSWTIVKNGGAEVQSSSASSPIRDTEASGDNMPTEEEMDMLMHEAEAES